MFGMRTCFSRTVFFGKLPVFDSHTPVYSRIFSYNFRPYHQKVNPKIEDRLKTEDSVGTDCRIVYRAPYVNYVRLAYGFTSISTAIVIPMIGSALMTSGFGTYPLMMGDLALINNSLEFTTLIGVMILVTSQITYVAFKYPFRIYHNSSNGKYIAIFQHLLPWKKFQEEFCAGEIKKVEKSYSLWHEVLYQIKTKRIILLEDHFYLPQDFNEMFSSNEKK